MMIYTQRKHCTTTIEPLESKVKSVVSSRSRCVARGKRVAHGGRIGCDGRDRRGGCGARGERVARGECVGPDRNGHERPAAPGSQWAMARAMAQAITRVMVRTTAPAMIARELRSVA